MGPTLRQAVKDVVTGAVHDAVDKQISGFDD